MKNTIEIKQMIESKGLAFASALKCARETKGWTQQQLGERVKLSKNTIARIEGCKFFPSMSTFFILCHHLNINIKLNENEL